MYQLIYIQNTTADDLFWEESKANDRWLIVMSPRTTVLLLFRCNLMLHDLIFQWRATRKDMQDFV